jgi:hypothetical protein
MYSVTITTITIPRTWQKFQTAKALQSLILVDDRTALISERVLSKILTPNGSADESLGGTRADH